MYARNSVATALVLLGLVACQHEPVQQQSRTDVPPPEDGLARLNVDGQRFRDLNRDGALQPYEDSRLRVQARVADLLARMTLAEKAGAMMHGTAPSSARNPAESAAGYDLNAARTLILESHITSFITRLSPGAVQLAEQNNALQRIAAGSRLGIPLLISTDPRNQFDSQAGMSVAAGGFSKWPGPLGLASIGDAALARRFGDTVRREYRAAGIQMALSPQADLATEPRWPRINGTYGEDPDLAARMVAACVAGYQNGATGVKADSVAGVIKHWVGYGAAQAGFDGHNYYGRHSQLSDAEFAAHLKPFDAAFKQQVAGVMPTYNIVQGVTTGGRALEEVGAGFSRQLLTDLLRGKHGFRGIVVSDWGITSDCPESCRTGKPAQSPRDIGMPWGVESLSRVERFAKAVDAGIDQFGGTEETNLLVEAVRSGKIREAQLDASVARILELKFRLGIFDQPLVDSAAAAKVIGAPASLAAALDAQHRSLVLLENRQALLPLAQGLRKVFVQGIAPEALAAYGLVSVATPAEAEVAIVRIAAPWQKLHDGFFFGSRHHEGSLDFQPGSKELALLESTSRAVPTVVVVSLDRPAILTQIRDKNRALVADFGVSDAALLDVLTGKARPEGRLPFELPSSMSEVEAQKPGAPHDTAHPLYAFGYGLRYR